LRLTFKQTYVVRWLPPAATFSADHDKNGTSCCCSYARQLIATT